MYRAIIFITALSLLLMTSCGSDKTQNNEYQNENIRIDMDFTNETSFTDREMIRLSDDGILYYYDVESGISVPICSKPNCNHLGLSASNPKPECDGYVPGLNTTCIAILNDKLYFLYTPESDSGDYSGFLNKVLCRANKDGTDRKTLAEISNAQSVDSAYYGEGHLAVGFSNTFDEHGNNYERTSSYVSVIDLSDGSVVSTEIKEGYQGRINNVYYKEGVLYFSYFYLIEDIDYTKWDTGSDEFNAYVDTICKTEIIKYDTNAQNEEIVWSGNGYCEDMNNGYSVIEESTIKAIRLSDGTAFDLGNEYCECAFTIDDTGIIISDYNNARHLFYDFNKKTIIEIGKSSTSDFLIITAVTDNKIYVSYYIDSDYVLGYISKEDFFSGSYDKTVKIESYND